MRMSLTTTWPLPNHAGYRLLLLEGKSSCLPVVRHGLVPALERTFRAPGVKKASQSLGGSVYLGKQVSMQDGLNAHEPCEATRSSENLLKTLFSKRIGSELELNPMQVLILHAPD